MNIKIIAVGKLKEKYLKEALEEYTKRLSRYAKISITELQDEKTPENASEKEEEMIKKLKGKEYLKAYRKALTSLPWILMERCCLQWNFPLSFQILEFREKVILII